MNERFSIGTVLGRGLGIWLRNLIPFLLITALVFSPAIAYGVIRGNGTFTTLDQWKTFVYSVFGFTYVLQIVCSAALTYGVVMELRGQRASVGSCIGTGLSRFFPTLGVGLLTLLCMIAGVFALIIGMFVVLCMLYVAVPASVLERPGLLGALKRSRELTKGHRWEIFGILVILGLIQRGLQAIIENAMGSPHSQAEALHFVYALLGLFVVYGSLSAVMTSVAYYYLRQEKEGTSAEELAKIFE